jgi:hypothetical protein
MVSEDYQRLQKSYAHNPLHTSDQLVAYPTGYNQNLRRQKKTKKKQLLASL